MTFDSNGSAIFRKAGFDWHKLSEKSEKLIVRVIHRRSEGRQNGQIWKSAISRARTQEQQTDFRTVTIMYEYIQSRKFNLLNSGMEILPQYH
jgi:hypothetical protein